MVAVPTSPTAVGVVLLVGVDLLLVNTLQGVEEATSLGAFTFLDLWGRFPS